MNYRLPSSLSTDAYINFNNNRDTLSQKPIGARIQPTEIKPYDYFARIKQQNDMRDHKAGYNNFFGYCHPRVAPPNWWAPCFNNKQIRQPLLQTCSK